MITKEPYTHRGPDIIYPDKGYYGPQGLIVENTPSEVLRRGFGSILLINSWLRQGLDTLPAPNQTVFYNRTKTGLIERIGVRYPDATAVYRTAVTLAREVQKECPDDEILRNRIGLLGHVAVTEPQTFTSANKRTGRVLYGRLRYGHGAANIKRGVDAVLDDTIPPELERLILLQNIVRCRNDTQPVPNELGGVYVEPDILADLEQQRALLDPYRYAHRTNRSKNDFDFNLYQLRQRLIKTLADGKLANEVSSVLIQDDYGPAAWLLSCEDMPFEAMTPEIARRMVTVNTKLLQMRVFSLLNGVANGGSFVRIADSNSDEKEREVQVVSWMPTEQV